MLKILIEPSIQQANCWDNLCIFSTAEKTTRKKQGFSSFSISFLLLLDIYVLSCQDSDLDEDQTQNLQLIWSENSSSLKVRKTKPGEKPTMLILKDQKKNPGSLKVQLRELTILMT